VIDSSEHERPDHQRSDHQRSDHQRSESFSQLQAEKRGNEGTERAAVRVEWSSTTGAERRTLIEKTPGKTAGLGHRRTSVELLRPHLMQVRRFDISRNECDGSDS
jgi:hypothetical protein